MKFHPQHNLHRLDGATPSERLFVGRKFSREEAGRTSKTGNFLGFVGDRQVVTERRKLRQQEVRSGEVPGLASQRRLEASSAKAILQLKTPLGLGLGKAGAIAPTSSEPWWFR